MTTVTIDNIEYELESLSDDAKAQLASLQFVDQKLAQLNAEAAAYQTARIGYANALNELLPTAEDKKKEKH
jgi:hypothetical protein